MTPSQALPCVTSANVDQSGGARHVFKASATASRRCATLEAAVTRVMARPRGSDVAVAKLAEHGRVAERDEHEEERVPAHDGDPGHARREAAEQPVNHDHPPS